MDDANELQWLYPDEFLQLVSCKLVPLDARRLYALATYLFVRAGELKALDWSDVDIERGIVSIRVAWDRDTGEIPDRRAPSVNVAAALEREHVNGICEWHVRSGCQRLSGSSRSSASHPVAFESLPKWRQWDSAPMFAASPNQRAKYAALASSAGW